MPLDLASDRFDLQRGAAIASERGKQGQLQAELTAVRPEEPS